MSDPTDPIISDLVKTGGSGLVSGGGVLFFAWRALTRSEADRAAERAAADEERKHVTEKLENVTRIVMEMSAKFDKELALLAQNAEVKNDRQAWIERKLEEFDERLRRVEGFRSRESGIQSAR